MTAAAPADVIDRLAQTTAAYPFRVWGFGESIAMEGLLAAGGTHHDLAARMLRDWAHAAPPLAQEPLAHVAPGVPLLELYQETGDARLLGRALELGAVLRGTQRGAYGARIHRPDLPGWKHEAWVDCMHLDGPFLALLGRAAGDGTWHDLAAELLLTHARVLQDERTGLFSHGFDDQAGEPNGVFWGRGQGWALLGLTDTLSALPGDIPPGREIQDRLQAQVVGLEQTEGGPGAWHTVVDHQDTYVEPSVAAFVALGVGRAVRRKQVPPQFQEMVTRALDATVRGIDASGALAGVSDATPVGADARHYGSRGRGVFPWGQGPALLALIERGGIRRG